MQIRGLARLCAVSVSLCLPLKTVCRTQPAGRSEGSEPAAAAARLLQCHRRAKSRRLTLMTKGVVFNLQAGTWSASNFHYVGGTHLNENGLVKMLRFSNWSDGFTSWFHDVVIMVFFQRDRLGIMDLHVPFYDLCQCSVPVQVKGMMYVYVVEG